MSCWKDIPEYKGKYQINELGEVRSFSSKSNGRLVPGSIDTNGRRQMEFTLGGKRQSIFHHKLVWWYHNGDVPVGLVIDHKDGNPLNNTISNLRLATPSQNSWNRKSNLGSATPYKGVSFHKRMKTTPYVMRVQRKGRSIAKYYNTAEEAALAYNMYAHAMDGEFAKLNNIYDFDINNFNIN